VSPQRDRKGPAIANASPLRGISVPLAGRPDAPFLVGAGTILRRHELEAARRARADFAVAPLLDVSLIDTAVSEGLPFIPGAFTPSEMHAAWSAGATFVKLFPASAVGPSFVRELFGSALVSMMSFSGIMALGYYHVAIIAVLVGLSDAQDRAHVRIEFAQFPLAVDRDRLRQAIRGDHFFDLLVVNQRQRLPIGRPRDARGFGRLDVLVDALEQCLVEDDVERRQLAAQDELRRHVVFALLGTVGGHRGAAKQLDDAFGNASTDIYAYERVGIAKGRTWIIGPNAGQGGTIPVSGGWGAVADRLDGEPGVDQPGW